jgi:antitoxin (DNA-binding transcriptional repressor) of toxin-antitoxin stability system
MMKSASLSSIKSSFNSYLKTCGGEPVLVTKNGRAIAALIAVVDPDELERMQLANSKTLDAIFEKGLQDIRDGKGLTHEEVWAQVESWEKPSPIKSPPQRTRKTKLSTKSS